MRLRVTANEATNLLMALYDAIDYEISFLDAYRDCTDADADAQRIKQKTQGRIDRFQALRKKLGEQIREQRDRRKAGRI